MEVKISAEPSSGKKEKYSEHDIKHWADTIQQAEEIKADPEKMKLLSPMLSHKVKSIAGLRKLASKKMAEEVESPAEEASPDEEQD
jgi:hypothetical protein